MLPGAGLFNTRLNPAITTQAKSSAATLVAPMAAHWRGDSFRGSLMFKELAELDERVEQGLRDLVLIGSAGQLGLLFGI